ncbi:hypothetical protein A6046_07635 [[Haemophilus] ducreyi]|nr:YcgL domain-containing protein [[Haemophilus] ducreyi]AKO31622.1 hypothetical protein RY60_05450 [[Haemophilus] ducreyi]AKO33078.1 hypothetical protein RZ57_05500 [[Haemophilus] ducreyi]AKO34527.1 hypothetical protein RZ58_05500 [[Haemophilus] ducreyi]AKO35962.1 hypothetical protein RZ59_05435 [[Haemophilus] ducreyi]AKO37418.1 hypothetical protein RZ61_05475 [[Haemophilus] ducreyi]
MNSNFCAIYKSMSKEGMFLYIAQRDKFNAVPEQLLQMFGKPQFVMLFNLAGEKPLKQVNNQDVLLAIKTQGFFLQISPPAENLLKQFLIQKGEKK